MGVEWLNRVAEEMWTLPLTSSMTATPRALTRPVTSRTFPEPFGVKASDGSRRAERTDSEYFTVPSTLAKFVLD